MLNTTASRLGFVGAGQMAKALGFPLVQKGKQNIIYIISSSLQEFPKVNFGK